MQEIRRSPIQVASFFPLFTGFILRKINIAPEKWMVRRLVFFWGPAYFQGFQLANSFRERTHPNGGCLGFLNHQLYVKMSRSLKSFEGHPLFSPLFFFPCHPYLPTTMGWLDRCVSNKNQWQLGWRQRSAMDTWCQFGQKLTPTNNPRKRTARRKFLAPWNSGCLHAAPKRKGKLFSKPKFF